MVVTMYQSSEREEQARDKLYEYNRDLRGALLDVLSIVRASTDPWGASLGTPMSRPDELRRETARIEREDEIIRRARRVIDGTKDAKWFVGKLPSEKME